MRPPYVKCLCGIGFSALFLLVLGCADRSLWLEVTSLNPYVRQKWEADEQYGPTYYTRSEELKTIRETARQMTPVVRDRIASQLVEMISRESNPLLRREAVMTLGYLPTSVGNPALNAAAEDQDRDVRVAVCQAWGKRGGPDGAAALASIVSNENDVDVRIVAITELGKFTGDTALQALSVALEDSDPAVQYRAVQSLRTASERDYGNNVRAWRQYLRGENPPEPPRPSIVERLRRGTF